MLTIQRQRTDLEKFRKEKAKPAKLAIHYGIAECSLGQVLVAATDKGVCAILLGDTVEEVTRDLDDRFADAELILNAAKVRPWLAAVGRMVDSPESPCELPIDLHGTPFQERVWAALREVPCGTKTTYTDIAARLGIPNSVRAVAGAIAANPLAVVVPCHRVIRSDGSLSGYRWGVNRKQELLRREAR